MGIYPDAEALPGLFHEAFPGLQRLPLVFVLISVAISDVLVLAWSSHKGVSVCKHPGPAAQSSVL